MPFDPHSLDKLKPPFIFVSADIDDTFATVVNTKKASLSDWRWGDNA
jgi:hypothetical protein